LTSFSTIVTEKMTGKIDSCLSHSNEEVGTSNKLVESKLFQSSLLKSILSTFYKLLLRQYSFAKKIQSQTVIREKMRKTLSYKKVGCKMLLKLAPGKKSLASPELKMGSVADIWQLHRIS